MFGLFKRRRATAQTTAPRPVEPPAAGADAEVGPLFAQAVAACRAGDIECAEALAREVVTRAHDHADAHLLLGQLAHRRGAYEDAADSYLLAACFAPQALEPHVQLGLLSLDRGDAAEAIEPLERALACAPDDARALNAMGAALVQLERIDEARGHLERAVLRNPQSADAHGNLGYLLYRDYGEVERGRHHLERALELEPGHTAARVNYTMVMVRTDAAGAVAECDRLLAAQPALDPVRLNRGLARLSLGEFERGWDDYEARKSVRCNYVPRRLPWPEWPGGRAAGGAVYIHTEQGLGDEIMFASCLPDALREAGECVIETSPKLQSLFARSFEARVVVQPDGAVALPDDLRIASHVAIGSLPGRYRRSHADFPRHDGYLRAAPAKVRRWRERLATLPAGLKVGIAWRGGMASTQQSLRSMALSDWLPILATPDVQFIDMQHLDHAAEREAIQQQTGIRVHHWPDAHADYDDTAALVCGLDLVISVQTALVHLAGALGKETWGLIAATPEWRYGVAGDTMPWYPAVTLYRQPAVGDWATPVRRIAAALAERVRG